MYAQCLWLSLLSKMNAFSIIGIAALLLALSVQASRRYSLIPLTTPLTDEQRRLIKEQGDNFGANNTAWRIYRARLFYEENPSLRLHAVKHVQDKAATNEDKIQVFMTYFGRIYLPRFSDKEVISLFANDHDYAFNLYYSVVGRPEQILTDDFFKNDPKHYYTDNMTILHVAVMMNRAAVVEHILSLNLRTKLQVDKPLAHRPKVTARNERIRREMLKLLIIDKTKHELSRVKTALKEDFEITVKEAVIANNFDMLQASMLLGNHGDKNDESIFKYAVANKNFLIIEALIMEDYVIPDLTPAELEGLARDEIFYISKNKLSDSRVPFETRLGYFCDFLNDSCF